MCRINLFLVGVLTLLGGKTPVLAQADAPAAPAAQTAPLILPLVNRSPDQRVLLAVEWQGEADFMKQVLRDRKMKSDHIIRFDVNQTDYSNYHLVVGGSNCMDAYGAVPDPAAFDPMEKFVAEGGHLLLFGTYNGRHGGNLSRFGIATGGNHDYAGFDPIPGRSEVLFDGLEKLVPADGKLASAGHFEVSVPHVAFLKRRAANTSNPGAASLVTLAYKKGRVTFSQVEPDYQGDRWLLEILLNWSLRGAPTVKEQLNQTVVWDQQTLAELRKQAIPSQAALDAADQQIRTELIDDIATATTSEDLRKLGDRLAEMQQQATDPALAYQCLLQAQQYYLKAESPSRSFEMIRQLHAQFRIDVASLALETAKTAQETVKDPIGSAELAKECLDLAGDLSERGQYAAALTVASHATNAAQLAKHKHYSSVALAMTRRVTQLQSEWERVQSFADALKADPRNAEANLEIGRFYCLIAGQRERGWPLLALGSDPSLSQLAEAELKGTDDPNAQATLGALWLTVSGKVPASMRSAARSRAKAWFWRAMNQSSGAERTALERKASKIITPKAELRISFRESGEAQLILTRDQLQWKQVSGTPPDRVLVNLQSWAVGTQGPLRNAGSTQFFLEEVNLETVIMSKVRGKGTFELKSTSPEELVIDIRDQNDGEFALRFGQ
jgi:hypothetical protein